MIRRPPRFTLTDTRFPYTTLFRSRDATILVAGEEAGDYTPESILGDLFPSTEAPVVADWYSGALIIPDGERTKYVHMGYGSSRSEEHTSELQSLMRLSYAVFCLKKQKELTAYNQH